MPHNPMIQNEEKRMYACMPLLMIKPKTTVGGKYETNKMQDLLHPHAAEFLEVFFVISPDSYSGIISY